MKPDPLEDRMKSQPLRPIPAEWRDQIVAATRQAMEPADRGQASRRPTASSAFLSGFGALLWPSPKAWAGLAAIWMIIISLQVMTREAGLTSTAKLPDPPSEQWMQAWIEQRRMMVEMAERQEFPAFIRPSLTPNRPRSETIKEWGRA